MFKIVGPLKNQKGMTFIEVMMAIAVLGLFLTTCARVYSFVSRYDADTLERLRMAELAEAKMESIKADPAGYPQDDTNPITATTPDRTYSVLYEIPEEKPEMRKITVGPEGSGPDELRDSFSPSNYVLVSWIPPHVTPNVVELSSEAPVNPYKPGNWVDPDNNDYDPKNWNVAPSGISRIATGGGGGGPVELTKSIYYKTPFDTFNYITYTEFTKLTSKSADATGITFKTAAENPDVYIFYMYNGNKQDEFWLSFTKNGVVQEGFPIDTNIPIDTFNNTKYYFKAIGAEDGSLKLDFGFVDDSDVLNSKIPPVQYPPSYLDTSVNYLLGLYDSTSGDINSVFFYKFRPRWR
ncbi:type IV pilus modification PilV family protein [Desulfolucanica intricata]|uniref:type IV pilus modification PilV family protein n=1 Tax=Desulfolucanica intricata TaxID=1285191 RepID=UPI00082E61F2|nr:prepilin-type N-terminal cleavage/methylation domain-containing protein [Desulfolucanica intricata]